MSRNPWRALAAAALLAACASTSPDQAVDIDPLQSINRPIFRANDALDRWLLNPAATAWDRITPRSVSRAVEESLSAHQETSAKARAMLKETGADLDIGETIRELEAEMLAAANNLEFEKAALRRDQIRELKRALSPVSDDARSAPPKASRYPKLGR